MGVVFAKTQKGHAEIATKSGGLSPRERRALIFVDGKRSVEELRTMLLADDLQHTLGMLEEEGYIEFHDLTGVGPADSTPPDRLPSITAFGELPPQGDPIRLQMARNFMTNTLNTFVGSLGTSSLLERIERTGSHHDLRELFDDWYHAIVMSRDGRREAEMLRAKLLNVI